jgi:ankyrin repeat protein
MPVLERCGPDSAEAGAPKIVEILLSTGADPSPKDKLGYTAEMIACWYGE